MTTTTNEPDTTAPSLPIARPSAARPLLRWQVALAAAVGLVALVVGSLVVRVDYASVLPGSARPVAQLITVEGAPSYPPERSVAFTTVAVRTRGYVLADAFTGWLDDDVDVFPLEALLGGRSNDENQRYNAQLMATSQTIATTVALRTLGYEVPVITTGTIVRQLQEGTPAASVLQLDDVIVAVDGQPNDRVGKIGELLAVGGVGATHTLTVERPPGSTTRIDVQAATVPADDDPTRPILGFIPEERVVDVDLPVDVRINAGDVGGPSAGLAFTLSVLDVLTPGELTGGKKVAVTGTMSLDGTVGPVGGGRQKAIAVRNAGYAAFLVPSDEYDEVEKAVGAYLTVIAVDTLAEALDALDSLGGNARSIRSEAPPPSP